MTPTRPRLIERYPVLGYALVFAIIIVLVCIVGFLALHAG